MVSCCTGVLRIFDSQDNALVDVYAPLVFQTTGSVEFTVIIIVK